METSEQLHSPCWNEEHLKPPCCSQGCHRFQPGAFEALPEYCGRAELFPFLSLVPKPVGVFCAAEFQVSSSLSKHHPAFPFQGWQDLLLAPVSIPGATPGAVHPVSLWRLPQEAVTFSLRLLTLLTAQLSSAPGAGCFLLAPSQQLKMQWCLSSPGRCSGRALSCSGVTIPGAGVRMRILTARISCTSCSWQELRRGFALQILGLSSLFSP